MSHWQFSSSVMKSPLRSSAKLVLLAMDMHVNAMGSSCWPSHRTLCELTSMGATAVKDAIRAAEAEGWLRKVERFDGTGKNLSNEYFLQIPELPEVASGASELVDNLGVGKRPLEEGGRQTTGEGSLNDSPKRGRQTTTELPFELSKSNIGKKAAKRATQLPADFAVTDELRAWAMEKGYANPDTLKDAFVDHHTARASKFVDWVSAFRTWVRNDAKFSRSTTTKTVSKPSRFALESMNYGDTPNANIPF